MRQQCEEDGAFKCVKIHPENIVMLVNQVNKSLQINPFRSIDHLVTTISGWGIHFGSYIL